MSRYLFILLLFSTTVLFVACGPEPAAESTKPEPGDKHWADDKNPFPEVEDTFEDLEDGPKPMGWDSLIIDSLTIDERRKIVTPHFSEKAKILDGQKIVIEGYLLWLDENDMNELEIFSKTEFALSNLDWTKNNGMGAISVEFASREGLEVNQFIRLEGRLTLNDKNMDHMWFVLKDAKRVF